MIRTAEVNGQQYEIDTTPDKVMGRSVHAKIVRFEDRPASGPLANAISELIGRPSLTRHYYKVEQAEEREVVQTLGYRFSKSTAWGNLWEYWRAMDRQGYTCSADAWRNNPYLKDLERT